MSDQPWLDMAMTRLNLECPRECLPLQDWSANLITRSGQTLHVRPVRTDDRTRLDAFLKRVTIEDRRFRFLGEASGRPADRLEGMTDVDHVSSEHFVGFLANSHDIIASALFTADVDSATGGVAILIDRDHKDQGFGWALLAHVARFARSHGLKRLVSIESGQNHDALAVEQDMGFTVTALPGGKNLVLVEAEL